MPVNSDSTYSSSKANPSFFSNSAILLLVHLLSPLLEGLGRKWNIDSTNVLQVVLLIPY